MNTTSSNTPKRNPRITHRHILMAACALIAAGYLLMAGPATTQQAFCPDIFSTCRIVIAPLLCLGGYLLIIVAILRKKENVKNQQRY
ncbi:MAG: DUF3098 domain-containing protein [Prevotella sp.]|nr:DUF3098 domain-containing protein [Prevotella sp.]